MHSQGNLSIIVFTRLDANTVWGYNNPLQGGFLVVLQQPRNNLPLLCITEAFSQFTVSDLSSAIVCFVHLPWH